ncbi:uncharacterized protein [Lolium perenne]|uniref:uncharacterized protein n=1 Tax=Lolium perenne TaxID=4522 RepID=UPI003A992695
MRITLASSLSCPPSPPTRDARPLPPLMTSSTSFSDVVRCEVLHAVAILIEISDPNSSSRCWREKEVSRLCSIRGGTFDIAIGFSPSAASILGQMRSEDGGGRAVEEEEGVKDLERGHGLGSGSEAERGGWVDDGAGGVKYLAQAPGVVRRLLLRPLSLVVLSMFDATAPCNSTTSVMPVLGGSLSMMEVT